MARTNPSASFGEKFDTPKIQQGEKLKESVQPLDVKAKETAEAAKNVLDTKVKVSGELEDLMAQAELEISDKELERVKNLSTGKEILSNAEKAAGIESAPPEFVRGAGKALLAELSADPVFAGLGGQRMEATVAMYS